MSHQAGIRETKAGGFQVRYRDPGGVQRAKNFKRKTDAKRFLAEVKVDIRRGAWLDPVDTNQTVAQWVQKFQKNRRHKPASTQEREASSIKAHILPAFGGLPLGSVDRDDVEQWVEQLIAKGLAASTVRREFGVLRLIFAKACDSDKILRNPCRKIELPESESKEQRVFTPDEINRIYDAFAPRYKAMVFIGCFAGLRIGEQAALSIESFLWPTKQIDVQKNLFQPAKGDAIIDEPKTKYSRGKVDIPDFLVSEIASHLQQFPSDNLIFPSPEGEPLRVNNWRRRYWWPAIKAAGLGPECKPHSMRHTFVSLLIAEGLPIEKVCRQARHKSPDFTWRTYRHDFEQVAGKVSESAAALQRVHESSR